MKDWRDGDRDLSARLAVLERRSETAAIKALVRSGTPARWPGAVRPHAAPVTIPAGQLRIATPRRRAA